MSTTFLLLLWIICAILDIGSAKQWSQRRRKYKNVRYNSFNRGKGFLYSSYSSDSGDNSHGSDSDRDQFGNDNHSADDDRSDDNDRNNGGDRGDKSGIDKKK
ncbi:uncharacterized protein LOC130053258 [Ostrea edulis]|uniref:uncharacterized protein LOC130053258 n=1 Tax=Ostrea edulis TaxID=37623 RepID=UPI0024AE93D8|nr:uncharacterized protein LOC130053258 [Ostrea edulis]